MMRGAMLVATMLVGAVCAQRTPAAPSTRIVKGVEFTAEDERAVLRAVNFETFETLHYQYDVWAHRVRSIIAGRRYRTIESLAEVKEVTPFVLGNLLRDGARYFANKCAAAGQQQGRTYTGVRFSDAEATAALRLVNRFDAHEQLKSIGVHQRVVQNIYKIRPVCTLQELTAVAGVGRSVVQLIHKRVATALEGEECGAIPCVDGLVCVGFTLGYGSCQAASFAGTFTPTPKTLTVPAQGKSVSAVFDVTGLASVPMDIVLSMDGSNVVNREDLKIVFSVDGQEDFVYYNGVGAIPASRSDISNSRDDEVNRPWTVTITNNGAASGSITGLSLYLTSRYD